MHGQSLWGVGAGVKEGIGQSAVHRSPLALQVRAGPGLAREGQTLVVALALDGDRVTLPSRLTLHKDLERLL